jgi:type IV pilus assembly protein PilE
MKRFNGFTLVELMVTVAIVAILAAIALPAYRDYVIRGKLAEAYSVLGSQRVKMEQFYQDARTYVGTCANGTVAPPPTGSYFDYDCGTPGANTYTITANGKASEGLTGFRFTINEQNVRTTAAVPPGWTAPAGNCWTRTKGGSC